MVVLQRSAKTLQDIIADIIAAKASKARLVPSFANFGGTLGNASRSDDKNNYLLSSFDSVLLCLWLWPSNRVHEVKWHEWTQAPWLQNHYFVFQCIGHGDVLVCGYPFSRSKQEAVHLGIPPQSPSQGPGSTPVQSAQWRPFQSGTPVGPRDPAGIG